MDLDSHRIATWIEPLGRRPGELAEVFSEARREAHVELRDGELADVRSAAVSGVSARWRFGRDECLAFVPGTDEAAAREAVRRLQISLGKPPLPARPGPPPAAGRERTPLEVERWTRKLLGILGRHAPRHRLRWSLVESVRQVVLPRGATGAFSRRLVSVEGTFVAASRRGDEARSFAFHAPDADSTPDELRSALILAAEPRDAAVPCGDGETDIVLGEGCAAVLFHELLSHPLEAGDESPLSPLEQARVAVSELDVRDEPARLDLFGGYENDDEGVKPRPVKLVDGGRLAGRLLDAAHGAGKPGGSNGHGRRAAPSDFPLPRSSNLVVAPGHATADEMSRRLGSGLWIGELDGGSIELASGRFRLRFPRARRVRRGRLADECGAGIIAGEILPALKAIEAGLGRDVRVHRALGWCSRSGQVVPVQGAAPDVLFRKMAVRSAP